MTSIGGDIGSTRPYSGYLQQVQTQTQIKSQLSAMDFYLGVGFDKGYISPLDIKAALREEIMMLQDILTGWPSDGSQRDITYSSPVRQPDGSLKLIEKTEVMTKRQVQNLIEDLEQILSTI